MSGQVSRTSKIVWWGLFGVGMVLVGTAILNREWLVDWWRGMQYEASAEMAEIRDELALTGKGEFLFKALQPSLDEAEEFNANCHQNASETAVLGCYTGGQVRVYNITAPELDGIREVTTAHEMLHAVWARMSPSEQTNFAVALEEVLAENQAILGVELETYEADARTEELYVRAGTEIADLPGQLEEHYGEYFAERGRIVGFYNNYIAVFNEKKERTEALAEELPGLKVQIYALIDDYGVVAKELEGKVQEFNECARTTGCFQTQDEFMAQRTVLLAEQENLRAQNAEINAKIADYNAKIDEHNQIVNDSRKLEEQINSNGLPEVEL